MKINTEVDILFWCKRFHKFNESWWIFLEKNRCKRISWWISDGILARMNDEIIVTECMLWSNIATVFIWYQLSHTHKHELLLLQQNIFNFTKIYSTTLEVTRHFFFQINRITCTKHILVQTKMKFTQQPFTRYISSIIEV